MTRPKDDPGEANNPIVQYQEWAEHRYNSGHSLGGNVPPSTQNSGQVSVAVGSVLSTSGPVGGGAAYAFYYQRNTDDLIVVLLMLSVYFIPGLIMLSSRDRKKRRASQAQADPPEAAHDEHHHEHGRYSDRHDR